MKIFVDLILLMFSIAAVAKVGSQNPRRDDTYPPPDFLAGFTVLHDICQAKTGVTNDAIIQFSDGDAHEDPALKCYMNCLFHELKVVDDEGELHLETFRAMFPPDLKDILQIPLYACDNPVGETECDRAWWWHNCWKNADPKHYFLP